MGGRRAPQVLRGERPPLVLGLAAAFVAVTAATGAIFALKSIAPTFSLSVVYLPAVLLVSAYWGLALGLLTSVASATAFNFFHIPPVGRFTIASGRDWVGLTAFTLVALVVSFVAELARGRALEAERRRAEADLAAGLARELLAGADTRAALGTTSRRVAEGLEISSAAIELGMAAGDDRRTCVALRDSEGEQIATLLVPADLPPETDERLTKAVVPALEALVAIALRRDVLQAEAVATAALRHSDDVKTALLRTVSHDLRTPLTAIVAAGHALGARSLTAEERVELSAAVADEGGRLAELVEKLLDLSRLQAGSAVPRRDWVSLEEVLSSAQDGSRDPGVSVQVTVDEDVPAVRADAAQLERAFANVLENSRRYSGGRPVSVHARRTGKEVIVRIVDQGPGLAPAEQDRIFEPFYRGPGIEDSPWSGSGLGLAIARGFVEANDGSISVESLPGQGTSFVIAFPVEKPLIR